MYRRLVKILPALLLAICVGLSTGSFAPAAAAEIADYTAFPPFLPRVVSPNILFLLDYSRSMVRPAYGPLVPYGSNVPASNLFPNGRFKFFSHSDDYDPTVNYSGYFDNNYKYSCVPGGGGSSKCAKNTVGDFNGNWLNWLTATQFDVLKKVVVGGDVTASPEQGNPTKLQSLLDNVTIPNTAPAIEKDRTAPAQTVSNYLEFYRVVKEQNCNINAAAALCNTATPQRIPYNWIDPYASTVTDRELIWSSTYVDNKGIQKSLPFDFQYFNTPYSYVNITSNGYISFTNTEDTTTFSAIVTNLSLPNSNAPENIVAPFWDDLVVNNDIASTPSFVAVHTVGQTPNRIYVITFNNMYPFGVGSAPANNSTAVSFQVLLFENNSQIVFQYKDVDGGLAETNNTHGGATATIGLQNSSKTLAKNYSFNGTTLLENNLALHMTHGYKIFHVEPTSTYTTFRAAGRPNAEAYPVDIEIQTTAKVANLCPSGYYENKYNGKCYNHVTEGLLQEFRDGELAGLLGFRLGIMQFNPQDGGKVAKHFNEKDTTGWASLMTSTRSQIPLSDAPMAEALHMAQGYFRQDSTYNLGLGPASSWTNDGTAKACVATGNNYDPFCFQSAAQKVPCAKSYVLLVSSGNYSHDFGQNINDSSVISDKTSLNSAIRLTLGEVDAPGNNDKKNRAYGGLLDNVAYQMRAPSTSPPDLRADIEGNQNVSFYAVNTFGAGSGDGGQILKRAALYGGFKDDNGNGAYDSEDTNGNCILDSGEDTNNNGILDGEDDCTDPKTYFEASGGGDLRAKIVSAVTEILKNSASGTSVSVLSTSAGGEGALYQAYFYPARIESQKEDRKWPGFLRAFLLDTYQQLRDDHSGGTPDATLNTANDRIAKMFLDPESSEVKVNLYATPGKLAEPAPSPTATVGMDNVTSMWEGGTQLAKMDKSQRRIYLWHDNNNDGIVDNCDFSNLTGEAMEFVTANAATLAPYLRAQETTTVTATETVTVTKLAESTNIIDFIRGAEVSGYRSRCITVPGASQETGCLASNQRVWPLGDIIFSTPTLVGAPAEKYNLIYSDKSYFAFFNKYKNRRQVVYLGANDGMLHAFNAGSFNPTTVSFADNPSSGNGWTNPLPDLGDEIWAFLPYENLPHLAWLACNGTANDPATCNDSEYTHVYYADHRPRVTDAQIFNNVDMDLSNGDTSFTGIQGQANVEHPNGWGSVLILPLRLGGGAIAVTDDFDGSIETRQFQSAYYAFDVTDPEKPPKLLWRYTSSDLGFTTSYPAVARIDSNGQDPGGDVKWFMVVGSGPQNTTAVRDYGMTTATTQAGKIFIIDLATGLLAHKETVVAANTIMGDPIAVDVDLDFTTDVLYIGSTISATAGRVFRINTNQNISPASWTFSTLYDPDTTTFNADPDNNKDMGPLFVSPSVSMDRYGQLWVYFGSGRLKSSSDLTNSDQQIFYGIKDKCWKGVTSSSCSSDGRELGKNYAYSLTDLFNSSAVKVTTTTDSLTQVEAPANTACGANTTCSYQDMTANIQSQKKGWYITLDNPVDPGASERVLSRSSVIGGLVLFTAYQPDGDICSIFGNSYLYAVYYETGTASSTPVVGGNEGKFTIGTMEYVRPRISLGAGMPTSVGIAIGETVSGFVQKSTGEIIRIEATPVTKVRSSITGWRETTGNTGNAGVETIYEHIIK